MTEKTKEKKVKTNPKPSPIEIRLRIDLVLDADELDELVRLATMSGFLRENPRGEWTEEERKTAARYSVYQAVGKLVAKLKSGP